MSRRLNQTGVLGGGGAACISCHHVSGVGRLGGGTLCPYSRRHFVDGRGRAAGDNQISCLYCHGAAEKSKVAGLPAASTCMNCHSQIRKDSPEVQRVAQAVAENQPIAWVRIHRLPDHARFDHSRHVSAGIKCQSCHGAVETMERVAQVETLSMGMCVSCHRTHREVTLDESGNPIISKEATPRRAA